MKVLFLSLFLIMIHAVLFDAQGYTFDIPEDCRLSDSEMGELRGGYAEYYFTVDFSGSWTPEGAVAHLSYDGNVNSAGDRFAPLSNPSTIVAGAQTGNVTSRAMVGNMDGVQGIMQFSLVPGNNNVVTNHMNIYLTIINVADTSRLTSIRDILALGK